ncbi:MAG: hypothetical protein H7Z72_21245 [Bacteroidetes bacterium]|nr:hypothetical protein [Fibrella sp.]
MFHWLLRPTIYDKLYLGLLVVVSVVLISRYRNITYTIKPLLWLCLLHLGVELVADYLHFGFTPPIDNVFLYHLQTPLDYTFLAMFFYRTFADSRLKRLVYWSVPIFYGIALLLTLTYEPLDQVNGVAMLTESLLITFWCFQFFRSLLALSSEYYPERDPTFWIVVAVLFYFVGTFFTFGSLNYFLINDLEVGRKVYFASYVFYYLLYGTIGVTCLLNFPVRTHEH